MTAPTARPVARLLSGGVPLPGWWIEILLLLFRLHIGLTICINAGIPKIKAFPATDWFLEQVVELGFPLPGFFAFLGAWAEVIGGAFIALGLLTRLSALTLVIHFAVASYMFHELFPVVDLHIAHAYMWAFVAALALGSGRLSVDELIRRRFGGG